MTRARVSFAPLPPSDSGESPPASPLLTHDPVGLSDETTTEPSDVVGGTFARLERRCQTLVSFIEADIKQWALSRDRFSDIFLATLDGACRSPRSVTVKRFRKPSSWETSEISKFIQAWKDLNHDNLLGLLGYTLNHKNEIDLLISPHLINGNIRDFLSEVPMGAAERLGFVRDVTAGLDYLHSRSPPICHCNLDPRNVLVDENFNAVLTNWGLSGIVSSSSSRYVSPEDFLVEGGGAMEAKDVWSWGCVAFEILTDKPPFNQHEDEKQIYYSIVNRKAPGQLDLILDLVSGELKAEYACSLRLLHSYLPLCWDYEPRKRPRTSVLRRQVFMFSFENDAGDSVVATLEELAHLLIPPERLRIVEHSKLGAGNYGEVVFGILDETSTPRHVAVKRLKSVGTHGERVRLAKRLAKELNIWAKIKHPNIVELIGYYLDEKYESPLLIAALMTNGDVLKYIELHKPDIEQRIAFAKGITAGLACLHNFNPAICHADLKPANVLIDLQMNAVLCDFGLASFVSTGDLPGLVTTASLKGTPRYMSPELLLDSDCTHNLESDVWAWACTVFQVLTGRVPYAELTGDGQFYMALGERKPPGDVTLLLPNNTENVDSEPALHLRFLYSTLPQCWDFDPQNRPSICVLLSRISNVSAQIGNEAGGLATGDTQGRQGPPDPPSQRQSSTSGNEDALSDGSGDGMKFIEILEDPSGSCVEVESAQSYKRNVPTEAHPEVKMANKEDSRIGQEASAINGDADSEAQVGEDKTVTQIAADRSSLKISVQPLSSLAWTAALIISVSANIFFLLLRKVDPSPHQEASRTTYQERDS